MACGFSGNNDASERRKWSREIEEGEGATWKQRGYEREERVHPFRVLTHEKKLGVVLEKRRRDGERHVATAFAPVCCPPLFCVVRVVSAAFFLSRVQEACDAFGAPMPCYPYDVWRANCTTTNAFYNEIDHPIVRAVAYPPATIRESALRNRFLHALEHIFAFIKNLSLDINFFLSNLHP